jgi:hypothetical protein
LTTGAARPSARAGAGTIEVSDERVFGLRDAALPRRFARRVLSFAEVQSLALDPYQGNGNLELPMPVTCSAVSRAPSRSLIQV